MRTTLVRSAALTDPGNVRGNNEDRVYADDDRGIYIVIDGVGGEAGGERAAAIAEEELVARLSRTTGAVEDRIREGIALAGRRIFEYARRDPQYAGMACVLTVAVLSDGDAIVGHVGDTRLYKIHAGGIEKITQDHSPVGAREDAGEISEREAMQHPRRNEIFRDVGSEERSPYDADFIDIQRLAFEPDSALLLCSDGLTDQVASGEIAQTAARLSGDPHAIVRELVRLANDAGGKDNVSAIYIEGPAVAPAAAETVAAAPEPRRRRVLPVVLGALAGMVLTAAAAGTAYRLWTRNMPPAPRVLTVSSSTGIGAALADARAGDTILVPAGTYREQLDFKEGVRLVAAAGAVLEPRADAAQPGAAVRFRSLKSGSLWGLRIAISGASGVPTGLLIENSEVEIGGVDIQGAASAAILVRGTGRPVIRHSQIHDNPGAGIAVEDAAPLIVSNILSGNGSGIAVRGAASPEVLANAFAGNQTDLAWDGPPNRIADALKRNFVVPPPPRRPARRTQGSN